MGMGWDFVSPSKWQEMSMSPQMEAISGPTAVQCYATAYPASHSLMHQMVPD
jgi:hypothetical protein